MNAYGDSFSFGVYDELNYELFEHSLAKLILTDLENLEAEKHLNGK